jgi:hypothetical protein
MGWTVEIHFPATVRYFLYSEISKPSPGSIQLLTQWIPGLFAVLTRTGRESEHPPPSSDEVKSDGDKPQLSYTSSWCGA